MTQLIHLLLAFVLLGVSVPPQRTAEPTAVQPSNPRLAAVTLPSAEIIPARPELDAAPRGLPTNRPLRLAYYFPQDTTSLDSLRDNIRHLDVVAPHWLSIDETGTVESIEVADAKAFLRSSTALVLPSVALENKRAGHAILTDAAVFNQAIAQLVDAAAPWDGLALDFEGLDATDRAGLSDFVNALGKALHNQQKTYAVALPAKTSDVKTGWGGSYDYAAIAQAADLYLVMAYGFKTGSSTPPGSTAPLPWMDSSMAYAVSEIAPSKLILGVPFYGYDWNATKGPPARALRYRDTRELIERTGATPTIDAETSSAMFEYTSNGERHEVWYEDERSLAPKLSLVRKYGLRGVGAWRLGQEDPRAWVVWDQVLAFPGYVTAPLP